MTRRMAEVLVEHGGEMAMPPVSNESLGYKFDVKGAVSAEQAYQLLVD